MESNTPLSVEASPNREREVEHLYRTEGGKLWRAVMAYCGNPDVANDAVSEAFAQVLARGTEVHEPRSWLWRTTFRITAGELKRGRIEIEGVGDAAYEAPEPILDVLRALRTLSPKQREAVILHDYPDLPTREVARIKGIAIEDVSFEVQEGEILGIIRPSGAGKTTTVECLQGIRSPGRRLPRPDGAPAWWQERLTARASSG